MVIPLWVIVFSFQANLLFFLLAQHIDVPPREFLAVLRNIVGRHIGVGLRGEGVAAIDLADDCLAGQFVSLEFAPSIVFYLDVKVQSDSRCVRQFAISVRTLEVSFHLITNATHSDFADLPVGDPLFHLVLPFLLDVVLDLYIDVVINVELGNNVFDVISKL